ncbi:unnamed protein product [Auanema sp. JU1783]|nr:unnamed protein product [Auanema sp. JU1783]
MGFFFFFCVLAFILLGVWIGTAYLAYLVRHSKHGKYSLKKRSNVALLTVLGSGGHTTEMLELLKHFDEKYSPRVYVIAETDKMSETKMSQYARCEGVSSSIRYLPRSREVGQNYFSSVFTTLHSIACSFRLVWDANPDLVLVNGPGTCIPIVVAAALFDMLRLRDTVIIYEESLCRVESLSLSGALLYYSGLADDVIVQWEQLKEKYPHAVLASEL